MKGSSLFVLFCLSVALCAPVCAVAADTGVAIWGESRNAEYMSIPVSVWLDADSISAGDAHGLAAKNGIVYAWGDNAQNQCVVPIAASSSVTKVSANLAIPDMDANLNEFSAALRSDGEVVVWGDKYNQCRIGTNDFPAAVRARGVEDIDAGGNFMLALKSGTVYAWGRSGATNLPASVSSGIEQIAAGGDFALALNSAGQLTVWGNYPAVVTNVPLAVSGGGVSRIAAGSYHALALHNGTVYAWGNPKRGALDVPAAALSGVVEIAAGDCVNLALKADGTIVTWGTVWAAENMPQMAAGNVSAITIGGRFAMVKSARMNPRFSAASVSAPDATVGYAYSSTPVQAIGIPEPTYYKSGTWPSWIQLDAQTGEITGMPDATSTNTLTLLASNEWGTATSTILLHVYGETFAPTWVTTVGELTNAYVGVEYSVFLEATGNPAPTFVNGLYELPSGLTLSSNQLHGVPTQVNTNRPLIMNAVNSKGSEQLGNNNTLWYITEPVRPALTTISLADGTQQVPYDDVQLEATGSGTLRYSATGLPAGMNLSTTGLLGGTPTEAGTFSVAVVVSGVTMITNGETLASTNVLTLSITATYPPVLDAGALPEATVTSNYTTTISATSGTAPITYTATGVPTGLSFSTNGVLSGVPETAGSYTLVVTATNFRGSATANYSLTVVEAGSLPDEIPFTGMNFPSADETVLTWQNPTNNFYVVQVRGSTNLFLLDPDLYPWDMQPAGVTNFGVKISPWTNEMPSIYPLFYYQLRAVPK